MNKNTISKWFSMFVLMMVAGITGATAQSLTVADFSIEQGATKEIAISVAAADGQAIYGIQTDITLSEGLTLTNAAAINSSLMFTKNTLQSGPTRVSLLSQEGATITAGEAIKLTVTAASNFAGGTISLANSKLTTSAAGAEINVDNASANVTKAEPVGPVIPEGISYSWESPAGKPIEWGGTIAYVNGDGDRLNYQNSGYYTICLNGKKAYINDENASANAGKMVITLDKALAEGDTIAFTAYITKNSSSKASAWIVYENGVTAESAIFGDESNIYTAEGVEATGAINTKYVVVSAEAAGSKTITLTRSQAGTNLFITKLQIIEKKAEVDPLVAAKEALQTAIAIASNINPDGLADAIAAAQNALRAEDATAASLASAAQTLEAAIKSYFNEVLPRLGAIVGGLNDSTLNAAYANAQAVLAKEDVTPQELAAAMQQIIATAQDVAPEHLQNLKGYAVKYGEADAVTLVDNALAAINSGNVSQIIATMAAVKQAATPLAQQVLGGIINYVEAFGLTEQAAQAQAALESGNYVTMITVAKALYTHLIAAAKDYLPKLAVITEGLNDSTLNAAYANAQAVLANENVTPEDLGTAMQQIIVAAKAVAPAHLQNLRGYAVKYGQEGTAALVDSALIAINAGNVSKIIATMTAVREAATPLATSILQQMIGYAQSYNGFEADVTEAQAALSGGNYITMITTAKALYAKLIAAANDYVASAKAIPTEGKEGVDALNTAISAAEQALAAQDSDFSTINTAISNLVAAVKAFEEANLVTIDPTVIKPTTVIDAEFTNIADLAGQNFAIINKAEEKALYGSNNQNLAYDSYANAFSSSNSGYLWKLVSLADDADAEVHNYYRFQLITPTGADYNCWGMGGWLNSQPVSGSVSFILGLNNQNGQDIKNGAVYDVQYVEGQGFTIKNIATGLYQGANNGAAKNEEPTYFTFATVSNTYVPALEALLAEGAEYKALVTDEAALAAYDTAIAGIDPTAITGDGLTECQTVDAAITALAKAVPATIGQDYTRAIVNPSFELGNANGWTSNNGGNTVNNGNFGAATGPFFVEKWTAAPGKLSDGSLTQVVTGLPAGKYRLTAEMQNLEQGNNSANGTGFLLVANTDSTAVAVAGETVVVETVLAEGADLTIGAVMKDCSGNWVCVDNFQLTYVGAVATETEMAELTAEIAIAKTLNVDVTAYEGKTFAATEVTPTVETLKVAEYTQVNKDYTVNAAILIPEFAQWTGDMVSNKGQHWDGTGTSTYYEQTSAQWSQSSWTNNKQTTVKLPKGKYVLYAAGRASAGTACTAYIKVGDVTRNYTSKGDVGLGVATDGTASFDPAATYANGNKGRGFEYRYVAFEVIADEGEDISLEVGGSATAEHQWMSFTAPVLLTTEDNIAIMLPVLNGKITAAKAELESIQGTVGEGLFQKPQTAYDDYAAAVANAEALLGGGELTADAIKATIDAIDAKAQAFAAAPANAPAADKTYTFELRLGGETPLFMNLTENGITIAEEATPLKFVAIEGAEGQYNLTNEDGTLFVGLAGGNAWTMSTLADQKAAWTFTALPDGAYRINNLVTAGRFVGTNTADKEAGKPCYADKRTDNGNVDWLIAEYADPTELAQTLNVERYPGLGYTAQEATVDFTEAKTFLGVEAITTDMLRIVNPDGTQISDYATYDGWFNGQGAAETWGANTKVCVKFFQAIPEGKFEICDMNGADSIGAAYTVKWALVANDKQVTYTINVKFVEKPVIDLKFADLSVKETKTVALNSELGKCYEGLTADVDVAAILAKLEVTSLDDLTIYAVQSDGSLDDNYKLGTTDGWRNAAGDWQGWGDAAYFCVKTDFAAESSQIYYVGGMEGKNTLTDAANPAAYTATYAFVKTGTTDAVVLKVTLTYTMPTGINAIARDARKNAIFNMNGQKVQKAQRGLYIINGKKVVIK